MKIEEAIQQVTFDNLRIKTGINILYTASWLSNILGRVLKPFGITWQQFNILRILRGQKGQPASLRLVSERMIDQMSNTSRLVDKLFDKGLVERKQCPKDRRSVDLLLTPRGEEIANNAYAAIELSMQEVMKHMTSSKFEQVNALLDEIRN